ncbi:MAG: CDP-diacylglycerol--glycerol-3-phosphate 3-phosphatidyltransferase, partial [Alphaproteobacteria bacterium]
WYLISFILFVLGAASDWFDGYLARKYNVCSKLGGVLDHIGDKLLVCNTFILLALTLQIWYIVVPVIIMISRELYISGLREFLGTQKIEMPVPKNRFSLGKIKTTLQMITISVFLFFLVFNTFITPMNISNTHIVILKTLIKIGLVCLWASLVASIWSASQYTQTFIEKLKKVK